MERNRLFLGDNRVVMRDFPDEVFSTVITSPPFWGQRDYGLDPSLWDGDPDCAHEWGNTINCPTKIGEHGSTETIKNPALVMGMKKAHAGAFCRLCGCWFGCLGLEPTPELFISHLVDVFQEVKRLLRSDGVFWLNIGDSYAGSAKGIGKKPDPKWPAARSDDMKHKTDWKQVNLKAKDQVLIPFRLALALQNDGWWIRSTIIWHKPNAMPSSVQDRPGQDFEYVFMLTRSRYYYYDRHAIKEPYTKDLNRWGGDTIKEDTPKQSKYLDSQVMGVSSNLRAGRPMRPDPDGRNKRTVWTIPTRPFSHEVCEACATVYSGKEFKNLQQLIIDDKEKYRICSQCGGTRQWLSHFAAFPRELVNPMILAGSSPLSCAECGAPHKRVVESATTGRASTETEYERRSSAGSLATKRQAYRELGLESPPAAQTIGWEPSCGCGENPGSERSVVFDPFCGSGTTCAEALRLGRDYVGIDQNPLYVLLAERRIADIREEMRKEAESERLAGTQLDLFEEEVIK